MLGGMLFPIVPLWNSRALVPLVAVMAVSCLFSLYRNRQLHGNKAIDRFLVAGIALFLIAVVLSVFHAGEPTSAYVSAAKLTGNVVVACVLIYAAASMPREDAMISARCLLIGVIVTGVFFLGDVLSDGALSFAFTNMTYTPKYKFFWFKFASTVFVACSLIAGFYLARTRRTWAALVLAAIAIFVAASIGNRTAAAGIAVSIVLGLCYHLAGSWRNRILNALVLITFLLPLFVLQLGFSAERISQMIEVRNSASISFVYRMYTWEFVMKRIHERPFGGWGIDSSKRFGGETGAVISDPIMGDLGEPVPLHPHNGVLQIWLELGLVGVAGVLIFLARGLHLLDQRCRTAPDRIWAFSSVFLLICFFLFSYSAFSSTWVALLIFASAMLTGLTNRGQDTGTGQTESHELA